MILKNLSKSQSEKVIIVLNLNIKFQVSKYVLFDLCFTSIEYILIAVRTLIAVDGHDVLLVSSLKLTLGVALIFQSRPLLILFAILLLIIWQQRLKQYLHGPARQNLLLVIVQNDPEMRNNETNAAHEFEILSKGVLHITPLVIIDQDRFRHYHGLLNICQNHVKLFLIFAHLDKSSKMISFSKCYKISQYLCNDRQRMNINKDLFIESFQKQMIVN